MYYHVVLCKPHVFRHGCVLSYLLEVVELKVELGVTAASEASRYMDRPQRSDQVVAGDWRRSPQGDPGAEPLAVKCFKSRLF